MTATLPPLGSTVRVGDGKKLWTVTAYLRMAPGPGPATHASLKPLEGYTSASAELARLTIVDLPVPQPQPVVIDDGMRAGWIQGAKEGA